MNIPERPPPETTTGGGLLRPPPPSYLNRRKFSFPAVSFTPPDPAALSKRRFSNILDPATLNNLNKRRFSSVGDAVSRKFSTTIGWRRPPEEVVAVGRTLCTLYVRNRLKRANLFNKKLGLTRVRSAVNALPGAGSVAVKDVFPGLVCACAELERSYPRLYTNVARQTGIELETGAGGLLAAIGHHMFRIEPSWGKVVAVFSIAGGLAVDCVRQGYPDQLHDLLEGMTELLEDRVALWVASNGGWAGLNNHCRIEDEDISFVEYLGILALVLAILLAAYIIVKFFVQFSML